MDIICAYKERKKIVHQLLMQTNHIIILWFHFTKEDFSKKYTFANVFASTQITISLLQFGYFEHS